MILAPSELEGFIYFENEGWVSISTSPSAVRWSRKVTLYFKKRKRVLGFLWYTTCQHSVTVERVIHGGVTRKLEEYDSYAPYSKDLDELCTFLDEYLRGLWQKKSIPG